LPSAGRQHQEDARRRGPEWDGLVMDQRRRRRLCPAITVQGVRASGSPHGGDHGRGSAGCRAVSDSVTAQEGGRPAGTGGFLGILAC
jgi:hypothetical protein